MRSRLRLRGLRSLPHLSFRRQEKSRRSLRIRVESMRKPFERLKTLEVVGGMVEKVEVKGEVERA